MFIKALPLFCIIALTGCPAQELEKPSSFSFSLDGEIIAPGILSLVGKPGRASEGDFVEVSSTLLPLGPPGAYKWRVENRGRADQRIFQGNRLVAVSTDAFLALKPAEVSGLTGLYLERWSDAIAARLRESEIQTVTIRLGTTPAFDEGRLPWLPDRIRGLQVEVTDAATVLAWTALRGLPSLECLRFVGNKSKESKLDVDDLCELEHLRYLDLAELQLEQARSLSKLTGLHHLESRLGFPLEDLSFAGALGELRVLRIEHGRLDSLEGLVPSSPLIELSVRGNVVLEGMLSELRLTHLRLLNVRHTSLFSDDLSEFRDEHPNCRILAGPLQDELEPILRGCARIRARGPIVRTIVDGRLIEKRAGPIWEHEPARVREILGKIRVVEHLDPRGWYCGCGGGHAILDCYSDGKLAATLHLHHGFSVDWIGGPWTGQAGLTPESQEFLVEWLASRGIPVPRREREAGLQDQRVRIALRQSMRQAVPHADWAGVDQGLHRAPQAMLGRIADEKRRVQAALRILGCSEASWGGNRYVFDHDVMEVLDGLLPSPAHNALVTRALEEPLVSRGLISWMIDDDRWKSMSSDLLREWLPRAARMGLRSPQPVNRRLTLSMLRDLDLQVSTVCLRDLLDGAIPVRPLDPRLLPRAARASLVFEREPIFLRHCSDRAIAALLLAERRDLQSLPVIERILRDDHSALSAEDKTALAEAARKLKNQ